MVALTRPRLAASAVPALVVALALGLGLPSSAEPAARGPRPVSLTLDRTWGAPGEDVVATGTVPDRVAESSFALLQRRSRGRTWTTVDRVAVQPGGGYRLSGPLVEGRQDWKVRVGDLFSARRATRGIVPGPYDPDPGGPAFRHVHGSQYQRFAADVSATGRSVVTAGTGGPFLQDQLTRHAEQLPRDLTSYLVSSGAVSDDGLVLAMAQGQVAQTLGMRSQDLVRVPVPRARGRLSSVAVADDGSVTLTRRTRDGGQAWWWTPGRARALRLDVPAGTDPSTVGPDPATSREPATVSGDGATVAFVSSARLADDDVDDEPDVYLWHPGQAAPVLVDPGLGATGSPSLSGDGTRLAYLDVTAGEVVVRDLDAEEEVFRAAAVGGGVLSADGGTLGWVAAVETSPGEPAPAHPARLTDLATGVTTVSPVDADGHGLDALRVVPADGGRHAVVTTTVDPRTGEAYPITWAWTWDTEGVW
ncbi:hypothetical protein [Nocardioides sp. GY 10127]|uniref:hypothetical protein n=1 Tax=Nocardioides sp. GY 10127 TaxID=2569762 RepID=UPI0010A8A942|nr:hypothetical protein [Nocardioides sp. GY 10127]TIC81905.1 hypothetical protein E8D37_12110 [Nocardioides sp. GY 10127]